jgi:hypothetical protein
MRGSNGWIAVLWIAGCAETNVPCEPSGEHVTTAQGELCLYANDSPLVIEGGFTCPPELPFRFDATRGVACAERDLERLPENVCARIGGECESVGDVQPGPRPMEPEPGGREPGQPPSAEDPWREVAEERGFTRALEGQDFFAAMQYGCFVDTATPPSTWRELVAESDLALSAIIEEVVVVPELPDDAALTEDVFLRLEVREVAKGEPGASILVHATCGHGGTVAPLRERIPAEELLFLLHAPEQGRPELPSASGLLYYYLGIVRAQDGGLRYALGDEETTRPPLPELDSLPALLDSVRDLQQP